MPKSGSVATQSKETWISVANKRSNLHIREGSLWRALELSFPVLFPKIAVAEGLMFFIHEISFSV
jgi:hypothetical protein